MKITVIGGGHGSYAAVADMREKGHDVVWWRRDHNAFAPLFEAGGIRIDDHRGQRALPIGSAGGITVEADLGRAVAGAEIVIVPIPAFSHPDLAERIAPHLTDGQVVYLPPGSFGSVLFARAAAAAGNPAKVAFAETGTLPYLARKHGDSRVVVSGYATRLPTGVFPAHDSERALAVLAEIYPVEPVEDALSGALMNAGPIIHPPLILMNAGPLQHFPAWDIHNEGTQDAIRRVTTVLDAERIALRTALGYGAPHFPLADHYTPDGDEWMYGNAAHEKLTDSGDWRENIDLHTHRYMTEDVENGLALLTSVGRWAGVPTPVASGLLAIAGAITGRSADSGGRTLAALGLDGLDSTGMKQLLREGFSL